MTRDRLEKWIGNAIIFGITVLIVLLSLQENVGKLALLKANPQLGHLWVAKVSVPETRDVVAPNLSKRGTYGFVGNVYRDRRGNWHLDVSRGIMDIGLISWKGNPKETTLSLKNTGHFLSSAGINENTRVNILSESDFLSKNREYSIVFSENHINFNNINQKTRYIDYYYSSTRYMEIFSASIYRRFSFGLLFMFIIYIMMTMSVKIRSNVENMRIKRILGWSLWYFNRDAMREFGKYWLTGCLIGIFLPLLYILFEYFDVDQLELIKIVYPILYFSIAISIIYFIFFLFIGYVNRKALSSYVFKKSDIANLCIIVSVFIYFVGYNYNTTNIVLSTFSSVENYLSIVNPSWKMLEISSEREPLCAKNHQCVQIGLSNSNILSKFKIKEDINGINQIGIGSAKDINSIQIHISQGRLFDDSLKEAIISEKAYMYLRSLGNPIKLGSKLDMNYTLVGIFNSPIVEEYDLFGHMKMYGSSVFIPWKSLDLNQVPRSFFLPPYGNTYTIFMNPEAKKHTIAQMLNKGAAKSIEPSRYALSVEHESRKAVKSILYFFFTIILLSSFVLYQSVKAIFVSNLEQYIVFRMLGANIQYMSKKLIVSLCIYFSLGIIFAFGFIAIENAFLKYDVPYNIYLLFFLCFVAAVVSLSVSYATVSRMFAKNLGASYQNIQSM